MEFSENETGVHCLGKLRINMKDCLFSYNSEYGIKEDYLSTDSKERAQISILNGSLSFTGNSINWYCADEGVLTLEQIRRKTVSADVTEDIDL